MGFKKSFTMVYEDGKWLEAPDDFWIQNAGKPSQQIIAEQRTAGECGDQSTTRTATTTTTPTTTRSTTARLPANGSFAFPGTRYALPGSYSSYAPAQERPDKLDFEYKYHSLRNLEWDSWGPDGAQGTGAEWVQLGCEP